MGLLLAACGGGSSDAGAPRSAPAAAVSLPDADLVLASVSATGAVLDAGAGEAQLSGDGRHLVFESGSSNVDLLGAGFGSHLFAKDLRTGAVTRVDATPDGRPVDQDVEAWSVSADGRWVAFNHTSGGLLPDHPYGGMFLKDLATGALTAIGPSTENLKFSRGNRPMLSADAGRVAFVASGALVPEDTNGEPDVYVQDLRTMKLTRVSTAADGTQAVRDPKSTETDRDDCDGDCEPGPAPLVEAAALSPDGRTVAFFSRAANLVPDDPDHLGDLFVKSVDTGAIRRIWVPGDSAHDLRCLSLSGDGASVAFESYRPDYRQGPTFVARVAEGTARELSRREPGDAPGSCPTLTADGARVFSTGIPARFRGDGRTLDTGVVADVWAIWRVQATGGPAAEITTTRSVGAPAFAISGAGDRLALSTGEDRIREQDFNRSGDVYLWRVP